MYLMTCKYNLLYTFITNPRKFDQIDSISKFQKFGIFFSAKFFCLFTFWTMAGSSFRPTR